MDKEQLRMESNEEKLKVFFAEYAARFNRSLADKPEYDIEATAGAFANFFIEASPLGVNCGHNDDEFRAMIPKGFEFYRSIGTRSMKIPSLSITPLDDYHSMVKVHWAAQYEKQDGSEKRIEFDVYYFLQMIDDKTRIFAYITGDEQKVLRENGLIPAENQRQVQ
jgi:hypothetical protein